MNEAEINRECAALCGWERRKIPGSINCIFTNDFERFPEKADEGQPEVIWTVTDYCTDRNATPELLVAIERAGAQEAYNSYLCSVLLLDTFDHAGRVAIDIQKAEPRLVAEATLRATGRWREEIAE